MNRARAVVLCADDFAIGEHVSEAIVGLVDKSRLSAVSCMVTSRYWPEHAKRLMAWRGKVDVGLHLDLVSDPALCRDRDYEPAVRRHPSLLALIASCVLRLVNKAEIVEEVDRQVNRFTSCWGAPPDFIDGHLHVHQLPVVREALIEVYERRLAASRCYVRCVSRLIGSGGFKGLIIVGLGGKQLEESLDRREIPHNARFGGIYDFDSGREYRVQMRSWLAAADTSSLLMCHPGLDVTDVADPIGQCRSREYGYLSGPHFPLDCTEAGVHLVRFRDLPAQEPGAGTLA